MPRHTHTHTHTHTQVQRQVDAGLFRTAHREWAYHKHDLRRVVGLVDDLACPACSEGCAAVHIDANMKLFTWKRGREAWREHYFQNVFLPDASVQGQLQAIDAVTGTQVRGTLVAVAVCPWWCLFVIMPP